METAVWRNPPGVPEQFRIICARQNVHFREPKDCAFNTGGI